MKLSVVDAFSQQVFGGNTAGVVLLDAAEDFPTPAYMRSLAAELRYSETAFVKQLSPSLFHIRYFTPTEEVDLCGHVTIASFHVLKKSGRIADGTFTLNTLAGTLEIQVSGDAVLMDMAAPEWVRTFTEAECPALYAAFGCTERDMPSGLLPAIVSTGLRDIMLPVRSRETLDTLVMDKEAVSRLSEENGVIGFHVFFAPRDGDILAYCRNFAPLCGIDEESATGTSNGALTYYLHRNGRLHGNSFRIVQGESMNRPSEIRTEIVLSGERVLVRVGGCAVTVFSAEL